MKNKTKTQTKAKLDLVIEKLEKKIDHGHDTATTCRRIYCIAG